MFFSYLAARITYDALRGRALRKQNNREQKRERRASNRAQFNALSTSEKAYIYAGFTTSVALISAFVGGWGWFIMFALATVALFVVARVRRQR
jgi:hypothetical protein